MTTTAIAPNLPRTPVKPFYFNTSAHLLRITRQKARGPQEPGRIFGSASMRP
jgi:hypothetical protein